MPIESEDDRLAAETDEILRELDAEDEAERFSAQSEDARLLAEIELLYEEAKGTWTGREWHDGDKVTPESTDEQIAEMSARGELAVTCWGIDDGAEWHRKVRDAIAQAVAADDDEEVFAFACTCLRELAEESDAGVAKQAKQAENAGAKAMKYARAGQRQEAYVLAWEAARIERQYGDAPTWGPFAEAVRAWSEHEAE